MTWGQQSIWRAHDWFGTGSYVLNMSLVLPLDQAPSLDACMAALGNVIARHPALRCRFGRAGTHLYQDAAATGEVPLALFRADSLIDADRLAGERSRRLAQKPFDLTSEWPFRVDAVIVGNTVTHLAMAFCHVAVDGWASRLVMDELSAALTLKVVLCADPPEWTSLDQAFLECSNIGAVESDHAVEYWQERLAVAPASMFDVVAQPSAQPRYQQVLIRSAAMAAAASVLSRRYRTSYSSVLLTTVALALAAVGSRDTAVLQLIVGNRADERSRNLIAATAQNGLLVQRFPATFDLQQAIRATFRAATRAYFYGHYDPEHLDDVIKMTAARRGVYMDLNAYFNDARMGREPDERLSSMSETEVAALRSATTLETLATMTKHDSRFFAQLRHHPRECHLALLVDTEYVSRPATERMLLAIEEVLVRAVSSAVPIAEVFDSFSVVSGTRPSEWVRTSSGWVSPRTVSALVAECAEMGGRVSVFQDFTGGDGSTSLHAFLAGGTTYDLEDLHRRVVTALDRRTGVCAPHRYVLTDRTPHQYKDRAAWEARAVSDFVPTLGARTRAESDPRT